MKKVELIYFRGCPAVPNARRALKEARVEFVEVIQEDLPQGDSRRKVGSPSLLIDGKVVVGAWVEEASCILDRWESSEMRKRLEAFSAPKTLNTGQRALRAGAGLGFLLLAYATLGFWPAALLFCWF